MSEQYHLVRLIAIYAFIVVLKWPWRIFLNVSREFYRNDHTNKQTNKQKTLQKNSRAYCMADIPGIYLMRGRHKTTITEDTH